MDKKSIEVLEFNKIVNKLTEFADSIMGKEICKDLYPKTDIIEIEALLDETAQGASFIIRNGELSFETLHNISEQVRRAELLGLLSLGDLLKVADVLTLSSRLRKYITSNEQDIVNNLILELKEYPDIEKKIKTSILSEEEVADTASSDLMNIRRSIKNLQISIKDKLSKIIRASKYQKIMQESIITLRENRYVIPIKLEYKSEFKGIVHDTSASGATVFIEPLEVVESNNEIKKLKVKEQLEIERIISELTQDVAKIKIGLIGNISNLAKLDFIFAKAKLSFYYEAKRPIINDTGVIRLNNARHPLINKNVVVPINFWAGDDFKTLVITGPNTGGKTVSLKTAGLLTLMAQAGLNIPAGDGTEIAVFTNILADIGDEQSIEQSLSTFSSHIRNIIKIINNADSSSLILFDELGAGTDPVEGAALAIAILEYLRQVGATIVATTHYSQLKLYAISTEGVENASAEFDVETLRPTYKLLIGIPGKSNAFLISRKLGLSEEIIERAKNLLSAENIKFEDILANIQQNLNYSEQEKLKAEILNNEIKGLKIQLEDKERRIKETEEKILKEAREKAKQILLNARKDSEKIIFRLSQLEKRKDFKLKEVFDIKHELNDKIKDTQKDLTKPLIFSNNNDIDILKKLQPGIDVLILDLNQRGTVISYPDKNGEVLVQVGHVKINVKSSNIKIVEAKQLETGRVSTLGIGVSKSKTISREIDVRGFILDDAIEEVDKYIDDATISGLQEITIIHGKGMGVLRSGIWHFLKTHPHVKDYRAGVFGEGELGVTIVTLKSYS